MTDRLNQIRARAASSVPSQDRTNTEWLVSQIDRLATELAEARERSSERLTVVHQRDMEILALRTQVQRLGGLANAVDHAVEPAIDRAIRRDHSLCGVTPCSDCR